MGVLSREAVRRWLLFSMRRRPEEMRVEYSMQDERWTSGGVLIVQMAPLA